MKKVRKLKPRAVSVRMPIELFEYVCGIAGQENRSISQQIITMLQERIKK